MKRILLITSVLPWPLRRNGGAQRTALVKRALQKWGEVDILAIGGPELRESGSAFDQQLGEHQVLDCIIREPHPPTPPWYLPGPIGRLWRTIRQYEQNYEPDPAIATQLATRLKARSYDLIVSRYLQPALQAGVAAQTSIPKLLDFDDIDWSTFQANLAAKPWKGTSGRIASAQVLSRIKRSCDRAMPLFQRVFVTSDEDRAMLCSPATVLPNIPFSDRADAGIDPLPPATDSQELLFVGDLQFPPNRDGLDRFLTRVWPVVRGQMPAARLRIIGRGLTPERAQRWKAIDGTDVIGFADDLVDCYRRCAFTVVPIYSGGGTKIKILESLAFARTVVTTDHAMRGYGELSEPTPSVAVTVTDDDFAQACIRLLQTPFLRDAMATTGRRIVTERFSFGRFSSVIDEAVAEVLK